MFDLINTILSKIKQEKPLILNITNHVTLDFVANGLLSLGASPVMSFAEAEIEDFVKYSGALVVNMGTLNEQFNQLCHLVCKNGNQYGKPIIFDPVGAGSSLYRSESCHFIMKNYSISVIRANAGEIMALTGCHHQTKGVDSKACSTDIIQFAKTLSSQYDLAVCMSGKIDIIVDNDKKSEWDRGSAFMPMVTGTGCLLSAIVAAFHAVHKNRFEATHAASLFYAVCGEIAGKKSAGPASFKTHFIDTLNHRPEKKYYENKKSF